MLFNTYIVIMGWQIIQCPNQIEIHPFAPPQILQITVEHFFAPLAFSYQSSTEP